MKNIEPHIEIKVNDYDDSIFIAGWACIRFHLKKKGSAAISRKKWVYKKEYSIILKKNILEPERKEIINALKSKLEEDFRQRFTDYVKTLHKEWIIKNVEDCP